MKIECSSCKELFDDSNIIVTIWEGGYATSWTPYCKKCWKEKETKK